MEKRTNLKNWWAQFPQELQLITKCRLLASVGAGGVLYLTPLVFHPLLSASEISRGISAAAVAGTITRLITGASLDKGTRFTSPLKVAGLIAIIADSLLFKATNYSQFLTGEIVLGAAAGIYWPSIELAVPMCCDKYPSNKSFALARSSDALGVSIGALIGSLGAFLGKIRIIYSVEIICMLIFIYLITENTLIKKRSLANSIINEKESSNIDLGIKPQKQWWINLLPVLLLSLLATGILTLIQTALPLDMVIGGIKRPPVKEDLTALLIAIQLSLLLIIQWPIGNWLTNKGVKFGLRLSMLSFSFGTIILCFSSFYKNGLMLMIFSLLPISIGLASFLPTATEAVIRVTPQNKKGLAMALYSQSFGISAFIAPLISGYLIDLQSNAMLLWLLASMCCILITPLTKKVVLINR